jgi:predicted DNA-binding transcriptional regulator AlpA
MARKVDVSQLVGTQEIADSLGVDRSLVYKWQTRGLGFPDPVQRLTMGSLWSWPDVEAWARRTGRWPPKDG